MSPLIHPLIVRWQAMAPREKRLAGWAALVVGLAVLWSWHDWQQQEQRRLQKALPAAETRLKAMQKMADEYQQYAGQAKGGLKAPASAEVVAASLRARGLTFDVLPVGAGQLALKGSAGFDDWVDWVAGLAAQGWRVERATVQAAATPGSGLAQVDAVLVAAGQ